MERVYYVSMEPCWALSDLSGVECDMSGRPLVTKPPLVSPQECSPIDPQVADGALRCPTHGLEKFETMAAEGRLREVYRDGATVVYEVVR